MVNIKPILDKLGVDIGHKTAHTKTITETDINHFAELSGDFNPVHVNEAYAKKLSLVGRIITHRVLSLGLICAALAKLLGLVIFLGDTNKFLAPVRIGDTTTGEHQHTLPDSPNPIWPIIGASTKEFYI